MRTASLRNARIAAGYNEKPIGIFIDPSTSAVGRQLVESPRAPPPLSRPQVRRQPATSVIGTHRQRSAQAPWILVLRLDYTEADVTKSP